MKMASLKPSVTPEKIKSLLMDLGKPTKRGIRKCPQCGMMNGTRGLACKSASCDFVFKESVKSKKEQTVDAVKVVTGTLSQIYSVRFRERAPEQRGFVQLPLVQDLHGNPADNVDPNVLMSVLKSTAKCYVDSCNRGAANRPNAPVCLHIKAALDCKEEAQALRLKNSSLNSLSIDSEVTTVLWNLATETQGPLVQRVSDKIMVVKCAIDDSNPLGFVHFYLAPATKPRRNNGSPVKDRCDCRKLKHSNWKDELISGHCLHFYACIAAFQSDDALSEEYAHLLWSWQNNTLFVTESILPGNQSYAEDIELETEQCGEESLVVENVVDDSFHVISQASSGSSPDESSGVTTSTSHASHFAVESLGGVEDTELVHQQDASELITSVDDSAQTLHLLHPSSSVATTAVSQHGVPASEHSKTYSELGSPIQCVSASSNLHATSAGNVMHEDIIANSHLDFGVDEDSVSGNESGGGDTGDNVEIMLEHDSPLLMEEDPDVGPVLNSGDGITMATRQLKSGDVVQLQLQPPDAKRIKFTVVSSDNCQVVGDNHRIFTVSKNGSAISVMPRSARTDQPVATIASETSCAQTSFPTLQDSLLLGDISVGSEQRRVTSASPNIPAERPQYTMASELLRKRPVGASVFGRQPPLLRHQTSRTKTDQPETGVQFSFLQWLSSVTERINQTMHYQFPGQPDPLVFHAPQTFFEYLQARISCGSKKKRLPNATTSFVRRDALPLGCFTKYTWHITNILHVKQIFDTVQVAVDITRSFVENQDGSFDVMEKAESERDFSNDGKHLPIRPFQLKTYLKVGLTSPNQKEATPFTIEWIPDILPQSHIGELRIQFEYGHQRNGQLEDRAKTINGGN